VKARGFRDIDYTVSAYIVGTQMSNQDFTEEERQPGKEGGLHLLYKSKFLKECLPRKSLPMVLRILSQCVCLFVSLSLCVSLSSSEYVKSMAFLGPRIIGS
jgi:hypothetical protein